MDIDQSIAQFGEKLDQWLNTNLATFEGQDRAAQNRALVEGLKLMKEIDRLKADGIATLKALLDGHDQIPDDQRVASLIQGFVFGNRLMDVLHDELGDTAGETRVNRLVYDIVQVLDTLDPDRTALTALLDHPDAGVRGAAAAFLLAMMPERVIPILRDIEEKQRGSSPGFSASFTLARWEYGGKHEAKAK
jgi:Domain of unknown function (DUF2019)